MPYKNENPTDTIARLEAELAQLRADYSTLKRNYERLQHTCLLYTSDAADE